MFFNEESVLFQNAKKFCSPESFLILRGVSNQFLINWFLINKNTCLAKRLRLAYQLAANIYLFNVKSVSIVDVKQVNICWAICDTWNIGAFKLDSHLGL